MMRRDVLFAVAIACLVVCAHAHAQAPVSDAAKAMASGSWEFSNADRDKRCMIDVQDRAGGGRHEARIRQGLRRGLFPFIKEIAGWSSRENDFLRLLDAKGKSVLEFSEVETGMYEAPRPGEGILFIQAAHRASARRPRRPTR